MTEISFPGLGIGPFTVNREAFTLFNRFTVYWYAIVITAGMIVAVLYAIWRAKEYGISSDTMLTLAIFTIFFGVIGARIYYVIFKWNEYDSFLEMINIRNGGLAIYGGVIAGLITILLFCKIKKINAFALCDCCAPGVAIAQAMGRWGNFFNAEAHGGVVSSSNPLYFLRMGLFPNEDSLFETYYYHPTFFYESFWNVIGFVLMNVFYKKRKFKGEVTLWYFGWYGFGRMFIEGLRTDSLYLIPNVLRVSQLLGGLFFVVAVAADILVRILIKKNTAPAFLLFGTGEETAETPVEEAPADNTPAEETPAQENNEDASSESEEENHGDSN